MQIRQQQAKIKNLEKELVSKRTEAQRLRSEIARTSNEQINAIDDDDEEEVERLKRKVNRFRQLLQEANMREKDLEDELDKVKGEKLALTRTLDQLELEKATLEKGIARFRAIATPLFTAEQNGSVRDEVTESEANIRTTHADKSHESRPTKTAISESTITVSASDRSKTYKLSVRRGERNALSPIKIIETFASK